MLEENQPNSRKHTSVFPVKCRKGAGKETQVIPGLLFLKNFSRIPPWLTACENAIVLVDGVYLKYESWKPETRQQNLAVHVARLSCFRKEGQKEVPCSGIGIKLTVVWKMQSPRGSKPSPWGQPGKELNFQKVPNLWQGAKKIENDSVCIFIAGSFQSKQAQLWSKVSSKYSKVKHSIWECLSNAQDKWEWLDNDVKLWSAW